MQLANANIARIIHAGVDAPQMSGFTSRLATINALAERSPGFVWRLQDETGDGATGIEVLADEPRVIINLSVWQDVSSLFTFTYKTAHAKMIRDRTDWFEPVAGLANLALWWVDDGHQPTVAEAVARMRLLAANGPGPDAFTFGAAFSAGRKPIVANWPEKDCA